MQGKQERTGTGGKERRGCCHRPMVMQLGAKSGRREAASAEVGKEVGTWSLRCLESRDDKDQGNGESESVFLCYIHAHQWTSLENKRN